MMAWHRSEPFCAYVQRRRAQRVAWLAECYAHATTDHSRRLADRLAVAWRMPHIGDVLRPIDGNTPQISQGKRDRRSRAPSRPVGYLEGYRNAI